MIINRLNFRHLLVLALTLTSFSSHAGTVKTAKGRRAIVLLGEIETYKAGDILVVKGSSGDQAVLKVTAVRNRQALVEVQSGSVTPGNIALPRVPETKGLVNEVRKNVPFLWVGWLGYSLDSQTVKLTSTSSVELSGGTPTLKVGAFGRFTTDEPWTWEVGLGLDTLKTTGSNSLAACEGSTSCKFGMIALSPSARVGYRLGFGQAFGTELRLGTDLLMPVTTDSNVVELRAFNLLPVVTAGVKFKFGAREMNAIPIAIDYGMYVGNADVKLSRIMASVGYTWK